MDGIDDNEPEGNSDDGWCTPEMEGRMRRSIVDLEEAKERLRQSNELKGLKGVKSLKPSRDHARTPNLSPRDDMLQKYNDQFFVIKNLGGRSVIGTFKNGRLIVQVPREWRFAHASEPFADIWSKWGSRREYESVEFAPGEDLGPEILNLWKGFGCKPKKGNWTLLRNHMLTILCRDDLDAYAYLMNWIAWKIQHPGKPTESMICFIGPEGIGKGVLCRLINMIFADHGVQLCRTGDLVGRFNYILESKCYVFADEASFTGDEAAVRVLYSLITEPFLKTERKGFDAEVHKNRLAIMAATNNDWVMPVPKGARRHSFLRCADEKPNLQYFADLIYEIENGGAEAFLFDLLAHPLGDFHPRSHFINDELENQKDISFEDPQVEIIINQLTQMARDHANKPYSLPSEAVSIANAMHVVHIVPPRYGDRIALCIKVATKLRFGGWVKTKTSECNVWKPPAELQKIS